jgi:two-component system NtrC family sensor kinase
VLNAVDATADQGRIHVSVREEAGFLVLSVEDDGRGISIADRCRLFQPYFTTKAHGTGLGLFVSRQILEDFAGTLGFVSEPGQGSTFVVRLPFERATSPAMHSARERDRALAAAAPLECADAAHVST